MNIANDKQNQFQVCPAPRLRQQDRYRLELSLITAASKPRL